MNEKEMLMKQLRANAFPHNNGKVMQAINIIRHSYGWGSAFSSSWLSASRTGFSPEDRLA